MDTVTLTIDGQEIRTSPKTTVLQASEKASLYIPSLCYHPDLHPFSSIQPAANVYRGSNPTRGEESMPSDHRGCGLCVVEIDGREVLACETTVSEGMAVNTDSSILQARRQEHLATILANHPHACLTCAQREGCSRTQCSMNVPVMERCCEKFGRCEVQAVAEYIGIKSDTPRYVSRDLPVIKDEPLFVRDYNLCINCGRCVRACADLRGVIALGMAIGNGQTVVGTLAPTLAESGCKFCGACVEVCPTGTLLDKDIKGTDRQALVPCREACPLRLNIPEYVRRVAENKHPDAIQTVMERAPLPGILGRVCFHPCETQCRRGKVNEPIAICALKRFAWEKGEGKAFAEAPSPSTGKKVAVVGSGPAGITAAFYLSRRGHDLTLYESLPEPGGMLRYGIPEYRLPRPVVQADLADTLSRLEVKTGVTVGKDISLQELRSGYDAVLLAIGAQLSRRIPVPGNEFPGVVWGVDFLRQFRLGNGSRVSGRVAVIGGGNVAMDVALTARRLGVESVTVACLESREEMPAHKWECENALAEGIILHNRWGPKEILSAEGRVSGIELKKCTAVFDGEGRFNPTFEESSTMHLDADTVILAIGQAVDLSIFTPESGVKTSRGMIQVGEKTCRTAVQGIFAAGDAAGQSLSVVEAMASGVKAAAEIDTFLGGAGEFLIDDKLPVEADPHIGREDGFATLLRGVVPCLILEARSGGFAEIDLGYDEASAVAEAARCLQCDLRLCISPVMLPPEKWLSFCAESLEKVPDVEGVFQLLDEKKELLQISGVANLRQGLEGQLGNAKARYFLWEEDPMYTKRESELLQQFLQQHGRLPEGNEISDDLF